MLVIMLSIMLFSAILFMEAMTLLDTGGLYIIVCYDIKCNETYLKVYKNYNNVMKLLRWCIHENIDFKTYYYKDGKIKKLELI